MKLVVWRCRTDVLLPQLLQESDPVTLRPCDSESLQAEQDITYFQWRCSKAGVFGAVQCCSVLNVAAVSDVAHFLHTLAAGIQLSA